MCPFYRGALQERVDCSVSLFIMFFILYYLIIIFLGVVKTDKLEEQVIQRLNDDQKALIIR